MLSLNILAFYLAVATAQSLSSTSPPKASISAGTLVGETCSQNPSAAEFLGIPYAKPPTGNLRFEPPQAYNQSYTGGTRNATTAPPACIQFSSDQEAKPWSEDCLYLDIWTPANFTSSSALPVRVWVYGGANDYGSISNPTYSGCFVPDSGAVMVSINYRVGPLGWLAVEEAGIEGNFGLQDILLGLQWVQENIRYFGGDPKKLLLHGQSAGAVNTFTIATLPQAPKLISAAISESLGGKDAPLNTTAYYLGTAFAQALNCSSSNTTCLKSVGVDSITDVFNTLPLINSNPQPATVIPSINGFNFEPFVDGKVVPAQPSDAGVQVPTIFGSNAEEGTIFSLLQFLNGSSISATDSDYNHFLVSNFGTSLVPEILKYYPLSAFNSTPYPPFYAISTVITDASFYCPAHRALNTAVSKGIPAWTYYFDQEPNCPWFQYLTQEIDELLGPTHTAEIPFVMGITQNLPPPNGTCNMNATEVAVSSFMLEAWTSMAANQRPTANSSLWPEYRGANASYGIVIDIAAIPDLLNYTRCELWDQINAFQRELAYNGTLLGANATSVGTPSSNSSGTGSSTGSSSSASSTSVSTYNSGARRVDMSSMFGMIATGLLVVAGFL
ncbi:hypothetical protein LTR10_016563 [Elasticomyces elasticus]|uniref:Carboxylic ester hydrolase n=1 Tax=Exophiala sideris TaxID=1016849 RepID=A0ABR0IXG5_9EURO|nr:hypothetical protein LTR10_016563 [Elasticomyces elasticus]KAK5022069.1 hypothetical protein LTS07_010485 [Exophiala sideris]KAK5026263.1 hypothetical protein LTR13_010044 [Exophiala sideris]KAK5051052.1 hypothetical protein LTR69_010428 [Exophiala sideris]KAK5177304.1 hypothetical protein LTR44_010266 [Eurotiomycetes sp. CCFEE 6388]